MKKLFVLLLLALAIFAGYKLLFEPTPELNQSISLSNASIHQGNLILINKNIRLEKDPVELVHIPTDLGANVIVNDVYELHSDVIPPLKKLFEAAKQDGINHFIINSAYRSSHSQQKLYEEKGASYALPAGYSEHQSGLSLDIGSTQGTMDKAAEGRWLANNAARFGFILRYPENKENITGIAYEPWHFRYIGLPHSMKMQKSNLVFEEYVDYVKEKKHYFMSIEGIEYFVQYVEGDNKQTTLIPMTNEYTISGNNTDGYIITSILTH